MQNTALRAICTADSSCGAVQISAGRWGLNVGGGREVMGGGTCSGLGEVSRATETAWALAPEGCSARPCSRSCCF